jgi:photosystem II stability/assembly factor-like uncharacterized protein
MKMKRIILLMMCVLFTVILNGWEISRQCGFPVNIYDMDAVENQVWAVGSAGAVAHSDDNGETYEFVETPAYNPTENEYLDMSAVDFINPNEGLIGADDGVLMKTENGGFFWSVVEEFVSTENITDVYMISTTEWLVIGFDGKISKTTSAGANWEVIHNAGHQLTDITVVEDSIYIAVGTAPTGTSDNLYKSTNHGETWTMHNITGVNDVHLYSVDSYDGHTYVGGDDGLIVYSPDYFETFTVTTPVGSEDFKYQDFLLQDDTSYAVSWGGQLVSFDLGDTVYTSVENNFLQKFEGIEKNANGEMVACGWYGNLLKSVDNGENWTEQSAPYNALYAGDYGSESTWYFVGYYSYVIKTSDRGNTFEVLTIPNSNERFTAVEFIDENTGFVAGRTSGNIYKTIDGGLNWTTSTVDDVSSSKYFYDFFFVNDSTGYAMGPGSKSAKTTDAGETWVAFDSADLTTSDKFYSTWWFDENTGLATASSGTVYKTTNGGTNWETFTVGADRIYDIHFANNDNGVLVNNEGEIYYTHTGGLTADSWIQATEPAIDEVRGVTVDQNGDFIAVAYSSDTGNYGTSNVIMKSTDLGVTWTEQTIPELNFNKNRALGVFCADGHIVSYGSNNVIYRELLHISASPEITPNGGDFLNSVEVSLNCQTATANMYYTLDGTTPDETSTHYTEPFEITENLTLKVIAIADGYINSNVVEATYNIVELSAPQNVEVTFFDPILTIHWDAPATGEVEQYQVFRNDDLLATLTETSYQDTSYSYTQTYNYYVTASNDIGFIASDTVSIMTDEVITNAVNLEIQTDQNNVTLTWEILEVDATLRNSRNEFNSRVLSEFVIYRNTEMYATVASDVFTFEDLNLPNGTYEYYVVPVFETGNGGATNYVEVTINIQDNEDADTFVTRLLGNYPNPFNIGSSSRTNGTSISFELARKQNVEISIYNVKGQVVKTFVPETFNAGQHSVSWNGKDNTNKAQASGVYFYKVKTESKTFVDKMLIMK